MDCWIKTMINQFRNRDKRSKKELLFENMDLQTRLISAERLIEQYRNSNKDIELRELAIKTCADIEHCHYMSDQFMEEKAKRALLEELMPYVEVEKRNSRIVCYVVEYRASIYVGVKKNAH